MSVKVLPLNGLLSISFQIIKIYNTICLDKININTFLCDGTFLNNKKEKLFRKKLHSPVFNSITDIIATSNLFHLCYCLE